MQLEIILGYIVYEYQVLNHLQDSEADGRQKKQQGQFRHLGVEKNLHSAGIETPSVGL
jgi:hypothetical protein